MVGFAGGWGVEGVSTGRLAGNAFGVGDGVGFDSTVTVEAGGLGDAVETLRPLRDSGCSSVGTELLLGVEAPNAFFPLARTSCPEEPALTMARCLPKASSSTYTPGVAVGVGAEGGLIFIRLGTVAESWFSDPSLTWSRASANRSPKNFYNRVSDTVRRGCFTTLPQASPRPGKY